MAAVLAWSGHAAEPPDTGATPALPEGARTLLNIAYVTNASERQRLDLYLPATATHCPLIVWIHGGGWTGGSKEKPPGLRFLRYPVRPHTAQLSASKVSNPAEIRAD